METQVLGGAKDPCIYFWQRGTNKHFSVRKYFFVSNFSKALLHIPRMTKMNSTGIVEASTHKP